MDDQKFWFLFVYCLFICSTIARSIFTFLQPSYTYSRQDGVANIPISREIIEDGRTQVTYCTRDLTAKDKKVKYTNTSFSVIICSAFRSIWSYIWQHVILEVISVSPGLKEHAEVILIVWLW